MAQEQQLKYRILEDESETFPHPVTGEKITAHRIQALRTFKTRGVGAKWVREGDLGGYVSSEKNLAQDGSCWICNGSAALQNAKVQKSACLSGDSLMFDNTKLTGSARAADTTTLLGEVTIKDSAKALGKTQLEGSIVLQDKATVTDTVLQATDEKITIAGSLRGVKGLDDLKLSRSDSHDIFIVSTVCIRP